MSQPILKGESICVIFQLAICVVRLKWKVPPLSQLAHKTGVLLPSWLAVSSVPSWGPCSLCGAEWSCQTVTSPGMGWQGSNQLWPGAPWMEPGTAAPLQMSSASLRGAQSTALPAAAMWCEEVGSGVRCCTSPPIHTLIGSWAAAAHWKHFLAFKHLRNVGGSTGRSKTWA